MENLYLVKTGEIILKSGNRSEFEDALKRNIKRKLSGIRTRVDVQPGRFFVRADERDDATVADALATTPGLNGWSRAFACEKAAGAIFDLACEVAAKEAGKGKRRFKVEARRSDKSYPSSSYELARDAGAAILERVPGVSVDVHCPEFVVNVEIRDKAYVHAETNLGLRGLPVGTSGRGVLLLSGGIDSPVAGFRMACRGLALDAMYLHAYPYTSDEARDKVRKLARILARYSGPFELVTVPFTEVQLELKRAAPPNATTLYMRACMMLLADKLARERRASCIVTGESLGQVASQTSQNMRFTESFTTFPVFRPLIGTDKEETIDMARAIGSYETSILPYEDCCVLFSPKHPLLKADYDKEREGFAALGLEALIDDAYARKETETIEPEARE